MMATTSSTTSMRVCTGQSCLASCWPPCRSMPQSQVCFQAMIVRTHCLMLSSSKRAHAAALIFWGLGAFDVGLAVFTGRLLYLARHMVPCSHQDAQLSTEGRVELLKTRLRPIRRPHMSPP